MARKSVTFSSLIFGSLILFLFLTPDLIKAGGVNPDETDDGGTDTGDNTDIPINENPDTTVDTLPNITTDSNMTDISEIDTSGIDFNMTDIGTGDGTNTTSTDSSLDDLATLAAAIAALAELESKLNKTTGATDLPPISSGNTTMNNTDMTLAELGNDTMPAPNGSQIPVVALEEAPILSGEDCGKKTGCPKDKTCYHGTCVKIKDKYKCDVSGVGGDKNKDGKLKSRPGESCKNKKGKSSCCMYKNKELFCNAENDGEYGMCVPKKKGKKKRGSRK